MAAHSGILAWAVPWTEEPGGLQSRARKRVRHNWACVHSVLLLLDTTHRYSPESSSCWAPLSSLHVTEKEEPAPFCVTGLGWGSKNIPGSVPHRNTAQLGSPLSSAAAPHSMWWDLSSRTRAWTPLPALGMPSLKPRDPRGSPSGALEKWSLFWLLGVLFLESLYSF